MKEKLERPESRFSAGLGEKVCGVRPYAIAILADAILHILLFIYTFTGNYIYTAARLFISFVFFIYPFYFVADVMWSMRRSVCAILAGEKKINRKHYANTQLVGVPCSRLLPLTVSIPVYMEENAVIFETVRQSLAEVAAYTKQTGQKGNVVVSDDGLAPLLGGEVDTEKLVALFAEKENSLTEKEQKAKERIAFYRENNIGFVVRPAAGRAGRFKKASNLNYTLRLGTAIAAGEAAAELFSGGGKFAGGYKEGDVQTSEIILLLDKDSGVPQDIAAAVVPEFTADEKLAYVQCATNALNTKDNYFTTVMGYYTNNLFHNIWPCKALQGFFVPLVGHNVFLRKSSLEKSGLWAENRVSEDYDKAIDFYNKGYHGKFVHFEGLEFTEYVSRTFVEETGKQLRYSYGLIEMLFCGTVQLGKKRGNAEKGRTRSCDFLYMALYFCSVLNSALLLPTALLECYFGDVYLLWAGFLTCNIGFVFLPYIRSIKMRGRVPKVYIGNLWHTSVLALSFLGHTYAILTGVCKFFTDRLLPKPKPFPASSVDEMNYRFIDGLKLLFAYLRKSPTFVFVALLCVERGLFMLLYMPVGLPTLLTYGYIYFVSILVPVLLTPQLYMQPARAVKRLFAKQREKPAEKETVKL